MSTYVNIGGTWKAAVSVWCNTGSVWKNVSSIQPNIGGSYKSGGFNFTPLKYTGSLSSLSVARSGLAGTSVGSYALFAGGDGSDDESNVIDMYTTSLTRSSTILSVKRSDLASTSINETAIFGGGSNRTMIGVTFYSTVESYTLPASGSLFADRPTGLSVSRTSLAAASVGNYALFAGGQADSSEEGPSASSVVDAYYII